MPLGTVDVGEDLLAAGRSALGMGDAGDGEVLAAAVEQYLAADPPLQKEPDPDVAPGPRRPVSVYEAGELREARRALGGPGDVGGTEAVHRALGYVVARDDAEADVPRATGAAVPDGVPPMFAPDPLGVFTADESVPVVDPLAAFFRSFAGGGD